MSVKTKDHIETKELLLGAGINSFELHNWIRSGLLPGWSSREFYGGQGSRFWYPAWALKRAREIKYWRSQGYTMPEVREILREGVEPEWPI